MHITHSTWIKSLGQLRKKMLAEKIPDNILQKAIQQNIWFTHFYIEKSLTAILTWWEEKCLSAFLQQYPESTDAPKRVGIIAAGNVPCVGLHDILMVLWSGNIAFVKLSHQDEILIPFLIEKWTKYLPELQKRIFFVPKIDKVDFLIATGSNNTARYIEYYFDDIPKIIRKNRFSVAILRGNETFIELQALCYDMFLYNGMGCRNVSHIFALTEDIKPLQEAINQYDRQYISAIYLQKIAYDRAVYSLLPDDNSIDCGIIFLKKVAAPQYAPIGLLHLCFFATEEEMQAALSLYSPQIQCVVGIETRLGQAQHPALSDFADGVDVWKSIKK